MGWFVAGLGLAFAFEPFSREWIGGFIVVMGIAWGTQVEIKSALRKPRP